MILFGWKYLCILDDKIKKTDSYEIENVDKTKTILSGLGSAFTVGGSAFSHLVNR